NFPEAFGACLMKLNAEAGYSMAEGAKSTYETLTSWDKFNAATGLVHTITNPVETFNAIQYTAETFADFLQAACSKTLNEPYLGARTSVRQCLFIQTVRTVYFVKTKQAKVCAPERVQTA
ncbi:hypothetical protein, partial [Psychromonas antarctica]|uniref:hypothetical protein n=1 Tax=Psychromonas antarctica TaxID=67573 RepID=UPI001EE8F628